MFIIWGLVLGEEIRFQLSCCCQLLSWCSAVRRVLRRAFASEKFVTTPQQSLNHLKPVCQKFHTSKCCNTSNPNSFSCTSHENRWEWSVSKTGHSELRYTPLPHQFSDADLSQRLKHAGKKMQRKRNICALKLWATHLRIDKVNLGF